MTLKELQCRYVPALLAHTSAATIRTAQVLGIDRTHALPQGDEVEAGARGAPVEVRQTRLVTVPPCAWYSPCFVEQWLVLLSGRRSNRQQDPERLLGDLNCRVRALQCALARRLPFSTRNGRRRRARAHGSGSHRRGEMGEIANAKDVDSPAGSSARLAWARLRADPDVRAF